MVLGCNFLFSKRHIRKSATDFIRGAPKSTQLMIHHFGSLTDLIDPLERPQSLLPTASEKPRSSIVVALGAMYGDSEFSDFCEGSD